MCQDDDETDLKDIKEDNIDQKQVAGSFVHGYERSSSIKFPRILRVIEQLSFPRNNQLNGVA
jgi:hypothetical protein